MDIIRAKAVMQQYALEQRAAGRQIGLVPTMGALHEGHLSLVRQARQDGDRVVVSVFVNPTQFAPGEDFDTYPRTFEADCGACEELGVDVLFAPTAAEMYPVDAQTGVVQDRLGALLEGASRPTHFRGVLTVVLKLFHLAVPHQAYFGQKDYQQTVVIRRMVRDLDVPVGVRVMPTVREPDGLAMSSRNRGLSPVERRQAGCLWRALAGCGERFRLGERDPAVLTDAMSAEVRAEPDARLDYVRVVKPDTLEPAALVEPGDVVLFAVYVGETRLIDNLILGEAS